VSDDYRPGWVSQRTVAWVIDEAPDVPTSLFRTLMVFARHADNEGRGSRPSVATAMKGAQKSERQLRRDIQALLKLGLMLPGDPALVAHLDPNERPNVYDFPIWRQRGDGVRTQKPRGIAAEKAQRSGGVMDDTPTRVIHRGVMDDTRAGVMDDRSGGVMDDTQISLGTNPVEEPPASAAVNEPDPRDQTPATGEVSQPYTEIQAIDDAVAHALELRPAFTAGSVRKAIRAALASGRRIEHVAAAVDACYSDQTTNAPGRLTHDGPWWTVAEQAVRAADPEERRRKEREAAEVRARIRTQRQLDAERAAQAVPPNDAVKALREQLTARKNAPPAEITR
jgi:hypothetical protein